MPEFFADVASDAARWMSALAWASLSATAAGMLVRLLERRWTDAGGTLAVFAYAAVLARMLCPTVAPWEAPPAAPLWTALFLLWLAGFLASLALMAARSRALVGRLLANETAAPENVSAAFVAARRRIGLGMRPACVVVAPGDGPDGPAVAVGLLRPIVAVARRLADGPAEELDHILHHELVHLKKGDLAMNAIMQLALAAHWFNPAARFFAKRLRFAMERRCDEATCRALGGGVVRRAAYGRTLLTQSSAVSGAAAAEGGLCLAESPYELGRRVEGLFATRQRGGWAAAAAGLVAVLLAASAVLPGGLRAADSARLREAERRAAEAEKKAGAAKADKADAADKESDADSPPRIVKMDPPNHARQVDPNTPFLVLRFDQPMGGGRAWAQRDPKTFPAIDKDYDGPHWVDERTAVLAVRLEADKEYEILLNFKPFVGFYSQAGQPAPAVRYTFRTGKQKTDRARRQELARRQLESGDAKDDGGGDGDKPAGDGRPPRIVKMDPLNNARDLDPNTPLLILQFDRPMGDDIAWAQRDANTFPKIDESWTGPKWLDEKTAVLAVRLEPGKSYEILLNQPPFVGFRSVDGQAMRAVRYRFRTGPGPLSEKTRDEIRVRQLADFPDFAAGDPDADGRPRLLWTLPARGAADVDPNTPFLLARFDRPMGKGVSWVRIGKDSFPPVDADYDGPQWINDRTAVLAVELEGGHDYELYLNRGDYLNFLSAENAATLPETRYTFRTGSAKIDPAVRRRLSGEIHRRAADLDAAQ